MNPITPGSRSIRVGAEPHQVKWHWPTYENLNSDIASCRRLSIVLFGWLWFIELYMVRPKRNWLTSDRNERVAHAEAWIDSTDEAKYATGYNRTYLGTKTEEWK